MTTKRLVRIVQKPPYAYVAGMISMMVYLTICLATTAAIYAGIGLTFLVGGWLLFERGSTHHKRVAKRRERVRQLENDN